MSASSNRKNRKISSKQKKSYEKFILSSPTLFLRSNVEPYCIKVIDGKYPIKDPKICDLTEIDLDDIKDGIRKFERAYGIMKYLLDKMETQKLSHEELKILEEKRREVNFLLFNEFPLFEYVNEEPNSTKDSFDNLDDLVNEYYNFSK